MPMGKAKSKLSKREKMKIFIANLRRTGVILRACEAAEISRRTAYDWRDGDKPQEQKFRLAWDDALEDKFDEFEEVVYEAGLESDENPPDPDMAFRILARRRFKTWGNVEKHQIEGDINPVTIKFGENMANAFLIDKKKKEGEDAD